MPYRELQKEVYVFMENNKGKKSFFFLCFLFCPSRGRKTSRDIASLTTNTARENRDIIYIKGAQLFLQKRERDLHIIRQNNTLSEFFLNFSSS